MDFELRKESILVGLAFAFVYVLLAAGYVDSYDAVPSMETAKSIAKGDGFQLRISKGDKMVYHAGITGGWYTKMGLAMPVLYLPAVWLSKVITPQHQDNELYFRFLISLVNPILTSILMAFVYLFFRRHGYPRTNSVTLCIILGLGTYLFPYSKTSHREILQALALTAAYVLLAAPNPDRPERSTLYAGLWAALGLLTKQAFIVPFLPALIYGMSRDWALKNKTRNALLLYGPVFLAFTVWFVYSRNAWGGQTLTGLTGYEGAIRYNSRSWSTPFFYGLYLQLFSLDFGYFFYNPVLIIGLFVFLKRLISFRWTFIEGSLWLTVLLQIALYAKWYDPTGSGALGPRYLVVITPIFFLASAIPFRNASLKTFFRPLSVLLIGWSLLFEAMNVLVKPQMYWTLRYESPSKKLAPQWIATYSILKQKVIGKSETYSLRSLGADSDLSINIERHATLTGFNFWWLHLKKVRPDLRRTS